MEKVRNKNKFLSLINEANYFNVYYNPIEKVDGTLFSVRAKIKLRHLLHEKSSLNDKIYNLSDFFYLCKINSCLEKHTINEIIKIKEDIPILAGIPGLDSIIIDSHINFDDFYVVQEMKSLIKIASLFGINLKVSNFEEINDISAHKAFEFNLNFNIEKSDFIFNNLLESIMLASYTKHRGIITLNINEYSDIQLKKILDAALGMSVPVVAKNIRTICDFNLFKLKKIKFFEGEYIGESLRSSCVYNKYSRRKT